MTRLIKFPQCRSTPLTGHDHIGHMTASATSTTVNFIVNGLEAVDGAVTIVGSVVAERLPIMNASQHIVRVSSVCILTSSQYPLKTESAVSNRERTEDDHDYFLSVATGLASCG